MRAGFGAASLIMILLVLCLALMGVLTMLSARSDLALSVRHAELSRGYAEAAAQAQRALSDADAALQSAYLTSGSERQYALLCREITQVGNVQLEWVDDHSAVMRFDAGEDRQIEVCFRRMAWDEAQEKRMTVTAHRLIDTKEWSQTEGLILMDMDL